MEYKTVLIDPRSNTLDRCNYYIPENLVYNTKKLRLLDFKILTAGHNGYYFGLMGGYKLIRKITISDANGVVIDNPDIGLMGNRLLHMENATQLSVSRVLSQNMCNSVFVNSSNQVTLTERQGKDDVTEIFGYLDISFISQYLQARNVATGGLSIVIEWNRNIGFDYTFKQPPTLAFDQVLDSRIMPDKQDVFTFKTVVVNKLVIPATGQADQRLQNYENQYVNNLYYWVIGAGSNFFDLAYAQTNEKCEISIDGRYLMPFNGVDSNAKKLALMHDSTGEMCIPGYNSYVNLLEPFGVRNPNTGLTYNGIFSQGCIRINNFIARDINVKYTKSYTTPPTNLETLFIEAEILRYYDQKKGVAGFTRPPQMT